MIKFLNKVLLYGILLSGVNYYSLAYSSSQTKAGIISSFVDFASNSYEDAFQIDKNANVNADYDIIIGDYDTNIYESTVVENVPKIFRNEWTEYASRENYY